MPSICGLGRILDEAHTGEAKNSLTFPAAKAATRPYLGVRLCEQRGLSSRSGPIPQGGATRKIFGRFLSQRIVGPMRLDYCNSGSILGTPSDPPKR